jgi:hypothetical protein
VIDEVAKVFQERRRHNHVAVFFQQRHGPNANSRRITGSRSGRRAISSAAKPCDERRTKHAHPPAFAIADFVGWPLYDEQTGELVPRDTGSGKPWWRIW